MVEEIILEPRDAIYNAGLYGLFNLLIDACGDDEETEARIRSCSEGLLVPTKLLDGLEVKWVDHAIKLFGADCPLSRLLNQYSSLASMREESEKNVVNAYKKSLRDRLEKASYKSAYVIIADKGDAFDALTAYKEIRNLNDMEFVRASAPIANYLKRHRRTFLMKEIAYTVVNTYWTDKAFLSQSKNKKDIELCIKEDFIEPIVKWLDDKKKQTGSCLMCGRSASGVYTSPMTWICDMGVDDARKKSNFYNFVPDSYLCPLCTLVYSCLPFGFSIAGGDGLFINFSSDFKSMREANGRFAIMADETSEAAKENAEGSYRRFYHLRRRAYEALCNTENAKDRSGAVQIIQRRKNGDSVRYAVEQLSAEKVFVLQKCSEQFKKLTEMSVKLGDGGFINLFTEAVDNLMDGRSQHDLLNRIMRTYVGAGSRMRGVPELLRIEICFEEAIDRTRTKQEGKMDFSYAVYKKARAYSEKAAAMHDRLSRAEDGSPSEREKKVSNKLRGYIYKLLNQLNTRDYQGFADSVARMHLSCGEDFPTDMLMEMMISEDKFQTYGMAYIYGLSNGNASADNKDNNREEN